MLKCCVGASSSWSNPNWITLALKKPIPAIWKIPAIGKNTNEKMFSKFIAKEIFEYNTASVVMLIAVSNRPVTSPAKSKKNEKIKIRYLVNFTIDILDYVSTYSHNQRLHSLLEAMLEQKRAY